MCYKIIVDLNDKDAPYDGIFRGLNSNGCYAYQHQTPPFFIQIYLMILKTYGKPFTTLLLRFTTYASLNLNLFKYPNHSYQSTTGNYLIQFDVIGQNLFYTLRRCDFNYQNYIQDLWYI